MSADVDRQAPPRRRRSDALTADERRAEILQAVLPLLADRGPLVTSAEMAEAAGISQGTIFHVFGDKQAVIDAAVRASSDMEPITAPLADLAAEPDLVVRVATAIELICNRLAIVLPLLMKCGASKPAMDDDHPMVVLRRSLAALLRPDAAVLTHPPDQLAAMLAGLCMAAAHQAILEEQPLPDGAGIAALFLDGARRRPA